MSQLKNIKRWIGRINDGSSSDVIVIDALMKMRPYSKKQSGIRDIELSGGVESFLNLIQKPSKRILDISISLLANCLTDESVRKKVFESQGIIQIVKLLRSVKCNTILTRTCRSIANLASNVDCSKTLHAIGTVELIVQLIKLSSTPLECLMSALRAVKNLANTPDHRKKLIEHGIVSVLIKILNSREKEAIPSSLRALSEISKSCTIEFADHMLGNDGAPIRTLVEIIEEPSGNSRPQDALSVIVTLTLQGCARPTIGSVGGLKCIVEEMLKILEVAQQESEADKGPVQGPLPENSSRLLGALCYCCREAINRARLRSMDALPIFTRILDDNRWTCMHPFVLTTLLCFLYDEEGLKVLHDVGIFGVLLEKLQDFTKLERKAFEEKNCQKTVWDGHNLDGDENFDRRHSLSSDIPTKFNQRPTVQVAPDGMEDSFKDLIFDFEWRLREEVAPYSPQWSPAGPSPVPSELAFANDSSPTETPRAVSPSDCNAIGAQADISSRSQDHHLTAREPFPDQDDSSSSRDSFDQMHSPALLPATGRFNVFPDNLEMLFAEPPAYKRGRVSSSSSDGSKSARQIAEEGYDEEVDFDVRMQKDLRQAPKRAKIENLQQSGNDRIRSRSLDTSATRKTADSFRTSVVMDRESAGQTGHSSPPQEYVMPEMSGNACSPKFLKFVNETCSVSPQLLKQAGRDASSSPSDYVATPLWKQPKRRASGSSKKSEEVGDESSKNLSSGETESENKEVSLPQLIKTSSNPLPCGKDKAAPLDQLDDSTLTGPEPVTPVQVILCLLCHYCEVSENYIVSLALQDNCGKALTYYLQECPKPLDPKFSKIIDKLSGCTKCFSKNVSAFLMPWLTSTAVLRSHAIAPSSQSGHEGTCAKCGMIESFDCVSLVDHMWHNIAICHSSSYGSHLLKTMLTKGNDLEATASLCVVVLLFLWYWEGRELKSMSDELHKRLTSNLTVIVEKNLLELLCEILLNYQSTSKEFQCASYVFHKLVNISYSFAQTPHINDNSDTSQKVPSARNAGRSGSDRKKGCQYLKYCKSHKSERVLVFLSQKKEVSPESRNSRNLRRRKNSQAKKSFSKATAERSELPVHGDVLSEKSPMFSAMLQGKYRESTEKTVSMKDVTFKTASYIIHGMYGCIPDECAVMKDISREMLSSESRYETFRRCCKEQSYSYPFEMDVLRVMDLWLLPDARKDFYNKHKEFFVDAYISAEISAITKSVEETGLKTKTSESAECDITSKACHHKSLNAKMDPKEIISKSCFWTFVNNHAFHDIAQDYVHYFCSPCSFHHNHLFRSEVFAHALSASTDNESFIKIVLANLSHTFSKLVQQLRDLHKHD